MASFEQPKIPAGPDDEVFIETAAVKGDYFVSALALHLKATEAYGPGVVIKSSDQGTLRVFASEAAFDARQEDDAEQMQAELDAQRNNGRQS